MAIFGLSEKLKECILTNHFGSDQKNKNMSKNTLTNKHSIVI
jgi:hypothetical protein